MHISIVAKTVLRNDDQNEAFKKSKLTSVGDLCGFLFYLFVFMFGLKENQKRVLHKQI